MAAEDSSGEAAVSAATERMRPTRPPLQERRTDYAFTVFELLVVMTIILVLAGVILATSGYVLNKGARSRAAAEIAAISAALENFRADHGIYPRDARTDALKPRDPDASAYAPASLFLYDALAGATDGSRTPTAKSYFAFKPNQLSPPDHTQNVAFIRDPFGNSYGYSTAYQMSPTEGYNPTFDLWSTAGDSNPARWIKNW